MKAVVLTGKKQSFLFGNGKEERSQDGDWQKIGDCDDFFDSVFQIVVQS